MNFSSSNSKIKIFRCKEALHINETSILFMFNVYYSFKTYVILIVQLKSPLLKIILKALRNNPTIILRRFFYCNPINYFKFQI